MPAAGTESSAIDMLVGGNDSFGRGRENGIRGRYGRFIVRPRIESFTFKLVKPWQIGDGAQTEILREIPW